MKTSMNLININIGMILLKLCDLIIVLPAILRFASVLTRSDLGDIEEKHK